MRNTFGLSEKAICAIHAIFQKHHAVEDVLIYGSRAKGNYSAGSDIDLTLKGKNISTTLLLKIENELDDLLLPYNIDLSIYDMIEDGDLKEHITRVGKLFYSSTHCI